MKYALIIAGAVGVTALVTLLVTLGSKNAAASPVTKSGVDIEFGPATAEDPVTGETLTWNPKTGKYSATIPVDSSELETRVDASVELGGNEFELIQS